MKQYQLDYKREYNRKPKGVAPYQLPKKQLHRGYTYMFTPELESKFKELYPVTCGRDMAQLFGISVLTCYRFAKEFGLTKDQAAIFKKAGQHHRETVAADRKRMAAGLPTRTLYKYPQFSFTRSQLNRRYNALNRGYLVGSADEKLGQRYTIFFDKDTERSALFERNLVKAGFVLKEYIAPKEPRTPRQNYHYE